MIGVEMSVFEERWFRLIRKTAPGGVVLKKGGGIE